jgi:uncharacterized RmlC-like cupin family protein
VQPLGVVRAFTFRHDIPVNQATNVHPACTIGHRPIIRADAGGLTVTESVRVVRGEDLVHADPTPGMNRRKAFTAPGLWAGIVHTEPGATSGWHHHGEHETSLYVVAGRLRLEFGPGGDEVIEAGPGDFVHVPAGAVHRESNPEDVPSTAVIARSGDGPPTVNVPGPDPRPGT